MITTTVSVSEIEAKPAADTGGNVRWDVTVKMQVQGLGEGGIPVQKIYSSVGSIDAAIRDALLEVINWAPRLGQAAKNTLETLFPAPKRQ